MNASEAGQLAEYIVEHLRVRNRGQLDPAISAMTVEDYENLHGELALILQHGGRPPNWIRPEESTNYVPPEERTR